ncbi:MAG: hypothetical protein U0K87_01260 [Ruminococcus sp.]|nr:hypothetical protein [Ruminococcus sp.]
MMGIKIASRIEPTTMPTFLSAFGFVSMDTATFFKAAPTVAPIKIPPNRKAPTDSASRLVLHFIYVIVSVFFLMDFLTALSFLKSNATQHHVRA